MVVAVFSRTAVINEGSDTACDFPVTISGPLVCVKEAVVRVFFVWRWLRNWLKGVIDGAFKGGHLESGTQPVCAEVVVGQLRVRRPARSVARVWTLNQSRVVRKCSEQQHGGIVGESGQS
jgi:hypothetical protein